MGAEQSKEIASRSEEIKREALVNSQIQDPLEEVNLGEGSTQQSTYISAWLSALDNDQLLMVLKRYKDFLLVWLEIRLHKEPMFH